MIFKDRVGINPCGDSNFQMGQKLLFHRLGGFNKYIYIYIFFNVSKTEKIIIKKVIGRENI